MCRRQPHRKTLQLCEQIKDTLNWVLDSALADDRFALCHVAAVESLLGSSRVLVKVTVPSDLPIAEANEAMAKASRTLRMHVAETITRRKVPELIFVAFPAS